jgi:deoxyadenosine/deoxycytidine kinase
MLFANVTLQDEEFKVYKKLFQLMHKELPKPDVFVYLHQTTGRLQENIKKRGRLYEQKIEASYLQKINDSYLDFIKSQPPEKIKMIDISDKDFVNSRKDYLYVLTKILE